MHRQPSHHAEDIGARLVDPSSFAVLIKTTGVPKYKIGDSLVTCTLSPHVEQPVTLKTPAKGSA
jgi:hypothetical protein